MTLEINIEDLRKKTKEAIEKGNKRRAEKTAEEIRKAKEKKAEEDNEGYSKLL